MHELGIVLEVFELLDEIVNEQGLKKVSCVTLQIGELCSVMPEYFRECWNAAKTGGSYEKTELELTLIPAVAKCSCGCEYKMLENNRICPACRKTDYKIIKGREFTILQIEAY